MLKRGPVNSRFLVVWGVGQNLGSQDTVAQWPAPFADPALLFPVSRARPFTRFCILARLLRLGHGCPALYPLCAWYLQGPSPEQLQNPQILFLFPILCYPVEKCLPLPCQSPQYRKALSCPSFNNRAWGSTGWPRTLGLRPTANELVFLSWEGEGPDLRNAKAWFLPFRWLYSNRKQSRLISQLVTLVADVLNKLHSKQSMFGECVEFFFFFDSNIRR